MQLNTSMKTPGETAHKETMKSYLGYAHLSNLNLKKFKRKLTVTIQKHSKRVANQHRNKQNIQNFILNS